jgi:hypothetical protein
MNKIQVKILFSIIVLISGISGTKSFARNEIGSQAAMAASIDQSERYTKSEVTDAATRFFGSNEVQWVSDLFKKQGSPVGYIRGVEFSTALGGGIRYGSGTMYLKNGEKQKVYWRGTSIGLDVGLNATQVFTLVYNLENARDVFRRYPSVEGGAFTISGGSITIQSAEGITLAQMRKGIGIRAALNAGYTAYSSTRKFSPF